MDISKYKVTQDSKVHLNEWNTAPAVNKDFKKKSKKKLRKNIEKLSDLQDKLYASSKYGLLVIFQAMDAAGKDSSIKHVMSGVNPQGTQVFSFKQPSNTELDHDYMWRTSKALPERGRIGIFNRSYYEEVLVVKVHNLIKNQNIPAEFITEDIWERRYRQIRDFEKYLYENGIITVKFFLHLSKEEQKNRFLSRLDTPSKNWKFSSADLKEREYWDEYQKCYGDAISATSTGDAPWYIVPADNKDYTRMVISDVLVKTLKSLDIQYPVLDEDQLKSLEKYKNQLSGNI
jgi:PPK2 family polyphosphate:nucleotide phosphotransferase